MSRAVEIIKVTVPVIGTVALLVGVAYAISSFSNWRHGIRARLTRVATKRKVAHACSGLLIVALVAAILLLPVYNETPATSKWFRLAMIFLIIVGSLSLVRNLFAPGKWAVKSFYSCLLISTLLGALYGLKYRDLMPFVPGIAIRLTLLFLVMFESVRLFKSIFIDGGRGGLAARAALSLLSIFVLLIVLEGIFMFLPLSHGVGYTLAEQLWFSWYWTPENHYGYRDIEPEIDKPAILFVGDSFTAGMGIKDANDRYSNIVRRELRQRNQNLSVVNLGICGADTRAEYLAMKTLLEDKHIRPKIIVLQYYGNDIEVAALEHGLKPPGFTPYSGFPEFCVPLFNGSYLFNCLYWVALRRDNQPFTEFITHLYSNEPVLKMHERDLQQFITYANEHSIQLIVLVFPFMAEIEKARETYVEKMVHFFEANQVTVIDVSVLVENWPVRERVVNRNDSHAPKRVQKVVAQEILKHIN